MLSPAADSQAVWISGRRRCLDSLEKYLAQLLIAGLSGSPVVRGRSSEVPREVRITFAFQKTSKTSAETRACQDGDQKSALSTGASREAPVEKRAGGYLLKNNLLAICLGSTGRYH